MKIVVSYPRLVVFFISCILIGISIGTVLDFLWPFNLLISIFAGASLGCFFGKKFRVFRVVE